MNFRKKALVASSLTMILGTSLFSSEVYNIKSSSLEDAIKKISEISNMPYFVDERILAGKKSKAIKNISNVKKALKNVLKGTGLEAVIKNDTIVIKKKNELIKNKLSSNDLGKIDIVANLTNKSESSNSYTVDSMNTSTGLELSILDTPQSVSVITNKKMQDFNLSVIDDVLRNTPGITVESSESERTKYTARGFDLTNVLVDGVSLPLADQRNVLQIDTSIYDRIEVTRGATSLISGSGDPSGTVNMIRKKPSKEFMANANITLGSWNKRRVFADISGSLNENKSVRARTVLVKEESDSFIDRYEKDKKQIYAILEADVTDFSTFTIGASRLSDYSKSHTWGLPLLYDNGKATNFDRGTNASANWSYRDVVQSEIFSKLTHTFSNDWDLNVNTAYKKIDLDIAGTYIRGITIPTTHEISSLSALEKSTESKEKNLDINLKGSIDLFERDHDFIFGLNYAKRDSIGSIAYPTIKPSISDLTKWDGDVFKPVFDGYSTSADFDEKQKAIYATSKININDDFFTVLGARVSNWETSGLDYRSKDKNSKNSGVFMPYIGLVYKINDDLSTYASYTTSFNPSGKIDKDANTLDPSEGTNYELGIKSSFNDNKVNSSLSIFRTKQDNVAEEEGTLNDGRKYYSIHDGVSSKGVEVEVSGEVSKDFQLSFSYTRVEIEDKDGNKTKEYIPRNLIRIASTYTPLSLPKLQIGTSINWQDDISRLQANLGGKKIYTKQKAYAIANLMAKYKINKNLSLKLNINNITDEKYISSLESTQGIYGSPRAGYLKLDYKF